MVAIPPGAPGPAQAGHGWRSRIVASGTAPPDQLLANPLNWRRHPAFQEEAVRAALDSLGWIQQVVVNQTTGHVVDGHLRIAAAISRGEASVPVVYIALSPEEERLALATFDPLATLAVADQELLQDLLIEVRPQVDNDHLAKLLSDLAVGDLLKLTTQTDLDGLLQDDAPAPDLTEPGAARLDEEGARVTDQPPEALRKLHQQWQTAPGQLWRIPSQDGQRSHWLKVGDATNPAVVGPLAAYCTSSTVIVTSPPYGLGQGYEAPFVDRRTTPTPDDGRKSKDQLGGRPSPEGVLQWLDLIERFTKTWQPHVHAAAINLADHTVAPTPGFGRHTYGDLVRACQAAGWHYVATRIWTKPGVPGWGNNPYWLNSYKAAPEFEYVGFFMTPGKFPFKPVAERVPATEDWRFRSRWEFNRVFSQQAERGHHQAAFPVELPRRCILLFSDPGGTVIDPFAGTGTTLVAAEALGRSGVGVEVDLLFAAMALERLAQMGLQPEVCGE